jgi:hypothetical protein
MGWLGARVNDNNIIIQIGNSVGRELKRIIAK